MTTKKNDGKRRGTTLGLSRAKTWEFLFRKHGTAWTAKRYAEFMSREFPRIANPKKNTQVRKYLNRFNAGKLRGQEKKPGCVLRVKGVEVKRVA